MCGRCRKNIFFPKSLLIKIICARQRVFIILHPCHRHNITHFDRQYRNYLFIWFSTRFSCSLFGFCVFRLIKFHHHHHRELRRRVSAPCVYTFNKLISIIKNSLNLLSAGSFAWFTRASHTSMYDGCKIDWFSERILVWVENCCRIVAVVVATENVDVCMNVLLNSIMFENETKCARQKEIIFSNNFFFSLINKIIAFNDAYFFELNWFLLQIIIFHTLVDP